jgi:hypothetical protein
MGYGLIVTGAGDIFQIDSSLSNTRHAAVFKKSAGSVITGLTTEDVVFARIAQPTGQTSASGRLKEVYAVWTQTVSGSVVTKTCTFSNTVNYIVLKVASAASWAAITSASAADDYGLVVTNQSNVTCFDSRTLTYKDGFEIIKGFGKGTFAGGDFGGSGYGGGTVFTGNLTNKWVSMVGSDYDIDGNEVVIQNGFTYYYDPGSTTTGVIKYEGYEIYEIGIGSITAQENYPNLSEVLLGEVKE